MLRRCGWLAIAMVVLVAGCARERRIIPTTAGALAVQAEREAALNREPNWQLQGRIAVSTNGDGGNGHINWTHQASGQVIELSAPVSRQSWRLTSGDGTARIDGLEGGPKQGSDAATLLREATGWTIPFGRIEYWIRGMRAPGPAKIAFDEADRPALIHQDGWAIEYRDWFEADNGADAPGVALPRKLFAESAEARVRIIVERWHDTP